MIINFKLKTKFLGSTIDEYISYLLFPNFDVTDLLRN